MSKWYDDDQTDLRCCGNCEWMSTYGPDGMPLCGYVDGEEMDYDGPTTGFALRCWREPYSWQAMKFGLKQ